jgi:hypothetical protein
VKKTRKARTFERTYMGQDNLRHLVHEGAMQAACGQSFATAKYWGGDKLVTCIQCLSKDVRG